MKDEEIFSLIEQVKTSPEEVEHWKIIFPALDDSEKNELLEMLQQQKREKQVLATRQAVALADLLHAWNSEDEAKSNQG